MTSPAWNRLGDNPLTQAERQARYRIKKYAMYDNLPKIECACGCRELISPINRKGQLAQYKNGHQQGYELTQFKGGQKAWNKGMKVGLIYPNAKRGLKLTNEEIQKRTITRLANNNGKYQVKSGWKHKPLTVALMAKMNLESALYGEQNPSWLGGKSFELYGREFNNSLKQSIKERDGWKCVKCSAINRQTCLVIHHKDANKKNNVLSNLQTLCRTCHGRLHGMILQNLRVERMVI